MTLLEAITSQVSLSAFFHQALLIFALIVYGYVLVCVLSPDLSFAKRILYAYPAGLAAFTVTAFLLVTLHIPYGTLSASIACMAALCAVCLFRTVLTPGKTRWECFAGLWNVRGKEAVIAVLLIVILILVSCSGILKVSLSNDSMYNYWFYPRLIVHFGGLRPNFNTFLTDVGQGVALINTLPFLFGFEETFGIQHMLNLVFLATFFTALYEQVKSSTRWVKICFAGAGILLLASAMPYLLLSKWVLANDYFAVYMFLCLELACQPRRTKKPEQPVILLALFVTTLSLLRIEGGVYAVLLLLILSISDLTNKELSFALLVPVMILQGLYGARIFLTMSIIAPYRFLTEEKELLLFGVMTAELVYFLWIRGKVLVKIQKHLGILILAGLLGVNLLLFVKDAGLYLQNLHSFAENILYLGGWGIFPATVLGLYLISINRSFRPNLWDLSAFSYLLYVLIVSFMREGGMKSGVGDSGNRVLLQIVPVLLFAALKHTAYLLEKKEDSKSKAD